METIKIDDIINQTVRLYKEATDPAERIWFEDAINKLDLSIDNPDQREDTVRDYVGMDPYSWMVLPNFAELEERGDEYIYVEYADRMVVEAPLCY
jgi:hypothetical protein